MDPAENLTIRQPDDWHLHLRDGDVLSAVLPYTSAHFARAIIMPYLVPPVRTSADAEAYRSRIEEQIPGHHDFTPLMTLYLTESTDIEDLKAGAESGLVKAVKLYPAGATTNSDSGVRDIDKVMPVLEAMAAIDLPLLCHGEVTDPSVDIFDREAVFIERVMEPLRKRLPELRIVLEHVTTQDGVDYVQSASSKQAATITTHHLMIDRNHIFKGGIRPDYFCLPIAKRSDHKTALRKAATSGNPKFFLGTDSAPHPSRDKYTSCGCAGVFNAANTLSCLAQLFEEEDALGHLEAFTSLNGPAFYGVPYNENRIRLRKTEVPVTYPAEIQVGEDVIKTFDPETDLFWEVVKDDTN